MSLQPGDIVRLKTDFSGRTRRVHRVWSDAKGVEYVMLHKVLAGWSVWRSADLVRVNASPRAKAAPRRRALAQKRNGA